MIVLVVSMVLDGVKGVFSAMKRPGPSTKEVRRHEVHPSMRAAVVEPETLIRGKPSFWRVAPTQHHVGWGKVSCQAGQTMNVEQCHRRGRSKSDSGATGRW